jgi:hypothetical protein
MMNRWISVGVGGNTMAYTNILNGSSGWVRTNVFGSSGNAVFWNGSIAVAGGSGGNTIATSVNGTTWTGLGTTVFTSSGNDVMWNTKRWVATGTGGNSIAYSYNGTDWFVSPNTNVLTTGWTVGANSRMGISATHSGIRVNANERFVVNTPKQYDAGLSSDTTISFNTIL